MSFIGEWTSVLEVGRYGTLYPVYPNTVCQYVTDFCNLQHDADKLILCCQKYTRGRVAESDVHSALSEQLNHQYIEKIGNIR